MRGDMRGETQELRAALLTAFQAADSETAWFLDRRRMRVVSVRRGVVSDPLLRARDVEDDELRFVEIPALTEGDVHLWMEEYVDATGDPQVLACLDERLGANERFEEHLAKLSPERLAEWRRVRLERIGAVVDEWTAATLAEHVPGGGTGLAADE